MQVLRKLKWTYSLILIVCSVVFIACLFLHPSSNPLEDNSKLWLPNSQPANLKSRELVQKVFRRASMGDRTVILTIINQAWASPDSILDLFLESFRIGQGTKTLLNHLVIVAADGKAFQYCKSIHHPHCFRLRPSRINIAMEEPLMNSDHHRLGWRRIEFLQEVLELGYNFIYTDADVMWFRNPFPHFDSQNEITIACDFYTGDPQSRSNRADGGFFYAKSNALSIEFFKYWNMARVLHPNSHEWSVFEIIKHDQIFEMLGVRMKYLDTAYFGGFCQPRTEVNRVCTLHANCCNGTETKFHELRLVLDDWRKFTVLAAEKNSLRGSSAHSA